LLFVVMQARIIRSKGGGSDEQLHERERLKRDKRQKGGRKTMGNITTTTTCGTW